MKKYVNSKSLIVFSLALLMFLYLTNNYNSIFIRDIDKSLLEYLISHTQYGAVIFFELVTVMANWQTIVLVSLILLFSVRDKLMVIFISLASGITFMFNETLKSMFERLRPNVMQLTYATGYSMPSGHALISTVFYGLIILFITPNIKDKKYRMLTQILLTILIILICFSRVYLRVHYLSDVIAGMSLGLMIIIIIYNVKVGVFDNITTYIEGE